MSTRLPRPIDTDDEAHARQLEVYRRMGGTERVQVMFRLNAMTRALAMAGIRNRHPEYGDDQVLRALARLLHGDDLVRQAWPAQPLVDP